MKKTEEHPVLISTILGTLSGLLGVIGYTYGTFWLVMPMLLAPGIIMLCYKRIIAGFLISIVLIPLVWIFTEPFINTTINGRLMLPLTVYMTPGVSICTPYYDNEMNWQLSAILSFGIFLLFLNSIYLFLINPFFKLKLKTYCYSVSASVLLVSSLYPLSWGAKLTGTFRKSLSSPSEELISSVIFMLLFPLNMFILSYIANRMKKNRNKKPEKSRFKEGLSS